jgi:hypothetical protein
MRPLAFSSISQSRQRRSLTARESYLDFFQTLMGKIG